MTDVIDGRLPLQFCLEYVRNHLEATLPRIVIIWSKITITSIKQYSLKKNHLYILLKFINVL